MKKQLQPLAGDLRMPSEKQLLNNHMDAPMARVAKRDEVFHVMVLGFARNAFAHAVNVVNMQTLGRAAFPASVPVSLKNGGLVSSEGPLLFGPPAVLAAQRAAFRGLNRVASLLRGLALAATNLQASLERVGKAALNAGSDRSDFYGAPRSPRSLQGPHIQFSSRDRTALNTKALARTGRLEGRGAALARPVEIPHASHAPGFHLTRFAPLRVPAVRSPHHSAVGAFDRLVIRDGSHSQNVAAAFANG